MKKSLLVLSLGLLFSGYLFAHEITSSESPQQMQQMEKTQKAFSSSYILKTSIYEEEEGRKSLVSSGSVYIKPDENKIIPTEVINNEKSIFFVGANLKTDRNKEIDILEYNINIPVEQKEESKVPSDNKNWKISNLTVLSYHNSFNLGDGVSQEKKSDIVINGKRYSIETVIDKEIFK